MINKNMSSPWLTVIEACQYIKCGRTKLLELIHSGKIPYRRIDNAKKSKIRLLKHDLNKYLLYHGKIRLTIEEKEILKEISK